MRKKLILLFLLLSAALCSAGFLYSPAKKRVKGQVCVEGISVQGATRAQAEEKLAPLVSAWQARKITLLLPNGENRQIAHPVLQVATDFTSVWEAALQVKRGKEANLALTPVFSLNGFSAISEEIARRFYVPPQNAVLTFTDGPTPVFTVTAERYGSRVDEYALIKKVLAALPRLKETDNPCVAVPVKTLAPQTLAEDFRDKHRPLATFSSDYRNSLAERKHNVALATQKLSGAVLAPGETLSFNARVGERTEERGFQKAKVIEKGAFTEGVGGGVCQVSGTLYNAALLSGLTVTEYHQHSLAVSYLPPSRDAMVNYGTADLKIKNELSYPVYLHGRADGARLSFTFYGAPTGKTYALESAVTGSIPAPEPLLEQDDGSLFPSLIKGERKLIQRGREGTLSECYLIVTENGKSSRRLLRKNKYLPVREHVVLGGATAGIKEKKEGATLPSPTFYAEKK